MIVDAVQMINDTLCGQCNSLTRVRHHNTTVCFKISGVSNYSFRNTAFFRDVTLYITQFF